MILDAKYSDSQLIVSNVNTHVSTTIQQVKSTETNSQQQNNKDSVKDLNQNNLFANLNQSTFNPTLLKSKSDSKLNSKSIHPGHIKSQSKIHHSYVKYLNQSQEERDLHKTDYTYAHSFSYSSLVPRCERYCWPIPNMSRQSVSVLSQKEVIHSSNQMAQSNLKRATPVKTFSSPRSKFNHGPKTSTPKYSSNLTRSAAANLRNTYAYSDDDDDEEHNMPLNSNTRSRFDARKDSNINYCKSLFSEDDEDEEVNIIKRIINRTIVTTRHYLTRTKTEEFADSIGTNRDSNFIKRRYSPYGPRNDRSSCLPWPVLFAIPILLSGLAYYCYNGNNLNNLMEDISQTTTNLAHFIDRSRSSNPSFVSNDANDLSQFNFELQSLKKEIELMKLNRQDDPTKHGTISADLDQILERISTLELQITKCCRRSNLMAATSTNLTEVMESKMNTIIEERLHKFQNQYEKQLELELERQKSNLIDLIQREVVQHQSIESNNDQHVQGNNSIKVEEMIRLAIAKYDADKTGETDYALESSGGYVVSTRCSETYELNYASYKVFGLTLWRSRNSPRVVIQSGVVPGECWCFRGSEGRIAIHLSTRIEPTAFSYEHIPRSLARDGHIDSAPNSFAIYGLKSADDIEPNMLGEYQYQIEEPHQPLQRFPVQNENTAKHTFKYIEMVVKSNHGFPAYTCLYRFRVHGKPVFDADLYA